MDFSYEAIGKKNDKLDLRAWKVTRTLHVESQLTAAGPAPIPSLQPLEAGQQTRLQQQSAQMNKMAEQSAPQMASAQAIMEKCGDDDACMEREAAKLGQRMAGTPQMDATLKTGKETAAVGWRSQSGVQTHKFNGANEEGGTMTIRWRFQAQ